MDIWKRSRKDSWTSNGVQYMCHYQTRIPQWLTSCCPLMCCHIMSNLTYCVNRSIDGSLYITVMHLFQELLNILIVVERTLYTPMPVDMGMSKTSPMALPELTPINCVLLHAVKWWWSMDTTILRIIVVLEIYRSTSTSLLSLTTKSRYIGQDCSLKDEEESCKA